MDGHRRAEAPSHENHLARIHAMAVGKFVEDPQRITEKGVFAGASIAQAIAPVVDHHHSVFQMAAKRFHVLRNLFGIAAVVDNQ